MLLTPTNRYLLVEEGATNTEEETMVLVPTDYMTSQSSHTVVKILAAAADCTTPWEVGTTAIVEAHMLQHLQAFNSEFTLILENYVLGILESSKS